MESELTHGCLVGREMGNQAKGNIRQGWIAAIICGCGLLPILLYFLTRDYWQLTDPWQTPLPFRATTSYELLIPGISGFVIKPLLPPESARPT